MKRYVILSVLLFVAALARGQQRTTIEGLENHTEYQELVAQERLLVHSADSLAGQAAALRRELRTDTLAREAISASIVLIEEQSFDIRSRMARLASRINTIEQEWILESLKEVPPAAPDETGEEGESEASGEEEGAPALPPHNPANLVYSSWFREELSPDQLGELLRAQAAEVDVPPVVELYRATQRRMTELAREYRMATTQAAADGAALSLRELSAANRATGEALGTVWEDIFDSKSYIYNLLADRENRQGMLMQFEEGMEQLRRNQTVWNDAAEPLRNYVLQKRMLTDYEIALAHETGNTAAADSLRRVLQALPEPEILAGFSPIVLNERLFIEFADVTVGSVSREPVPEVKVWPRGMIWRVMLGSFISRQSPAGFRGARPIAFDRTGGRFRYFAGGFPDADSAEEAALRLKEAGLRNATVVAWVDGVMIDPGDDERIYRIEISGAAQLPTPIREALSVQNGVDVVRSEDGFIVTPLAGATALRLRTTFENIKSTYPGMDVTLSKIPE
jgi:hypothetical protein